MRPREREQPESPTPSPSTESVVAQPRVGGGLSSMVVRPSDCGSGSDAETDEPIADNDRKPSPLTSRHHESPQDLRRRGGSPAPRYRASSPIMRRRNSPPDFRRRQSPTIGFRRRDSPLGPRRRDSPSGFNPRPQRFHEDSALAGWRDHNAGYGMHARVISPSRRSRPDYYDPDLVHPVRSHGGRGFRGGRGGRFRDVSPPYGSGRGGRSLGRGYNASRREQSPFDGEYVHRNDPNLSPREGDWICRNQFCGNLNFARRSYCNKCNEFRYGPGIRGSSRSPQRGYYSSPPRQSPPRFSGLQSDRSFRRDMNGYRSPPRGWETEELINFGSGSPPRRGARFPDHLERERLDYHDDDYRERRKFDWPVHDQWERRDPDRDGFMPERRRFVGHTPSPRGRWINDTRERSRSPAGKRQYMRASFMDRGRGDRRYDSSFVSRGRSDDSDIGPARGYARGNGTFMSEGRSNTWKDR